MFNILSVKHNEINDKIKIFQKNKNRKNEQKKKKKKTTNKQKNHTKDSLQTA